MVNTKRGKKSVSSAKNVTKKKSASRKSVSRKSVSRKSVSRKSVSRKSAGVKRKAVAKRAVKKPVTRKGKKRAKAKAPRAPIITASGSSRVRKVTRKTLAKTQKGKVMPVSGKMTFSEGLEYPWGKAKRLWNILWALTIVGIVALIGYESKIVQAIISGNKKELPKFGKFGENLKIGFYLILKAIPMVAILWLVQQIPTVGGTLYVLLMIFFVPYLTLNLLYTNRIDAVFEVDKAAKAVFKNLGLYIEMLIKTILFVIIYAVLSLILVGIPCLQFGDWIYLADFYAITMEG